MFVKPVNKFPCHMLALLLCLMHDSIFLSLPSSLHSFLPSSLLSLLKSFLLSFLPAAFSYAIPCNFFWSNQSQPRWWPLYVISVSYFQIKCGGSCHKLIAQEPAQYAFGICAYIICCSLCYLQYRAHTHTHTHTTFFLWRIIPELLEWLHELFLHLSWVIHRSIHFFQ